MDSFLEFWLSAYSLLSQLESQSDQSVTSGSFGVKKFFFSVASSVLITIKTFLTTFFGNLLFEFIE